jgi:hypothetical protein
MKGNFNGTLLSQGLVEVILVGIESLYGDTPTRKINKNTYQWIKNELVARDLSRKEAGLVVENLTEKRILAEYAKLVKFALRKIMEYKVGKRKIAADINKGVIKPIKKHIDYPVLSDIFYYHNLINLAKEQDVKKKIAAFIVEETDRDVEEVLASIRSIKDDLVSIKLTDRFKK